MSIDIRALVEQLAHDPQQRRLLRAALLGDIDLEAAFDRIAAQQERTDATLAQLTAAVLELTHAQTRTEARLDELAQAQTRTEARLDELAKDVRGLALAQAETVGRLADLVDVVKGMNDRLGRLDGESFERRCRERGHGRFQSVARRLRLLDANDLSVLIDDAEVDGRLSQAEADSLLLTDAVFVGLSRGDGSPVHLAVEASVTIGHDDVRRARERADLLARVVDTPVLGVVTGEYAPTPVARAAQDADVWQVWQGRTIGPMESLPEE